MTDPVAQELCSERQPLPAEEVPQGCAARDETSIVLKEIFQGLASKKHLERERSLKKLERLLLDAKLTLKKQEFLSKIGSKTTKGGNEAPPSDGNKSSNGEAAAPVAPPLTWPPLPLACRLVDELLEEVRWEPRLGGLLATQVLVQSGFTGADWMDQLRGASMSMLEDEEVRIRMAVGDCLFALARADARQLALVFETCVPELLDSVERNFDRDAIGDIGSGDVDLLLQLKDNASASSSAAGSESGRSDALASDVGSEDFRRGLVQLNTDPFIGGGGAGDDLSGGAMTPRRQMGLTAGFLGEALLKSVYRPAHLGRGELRHGTEGWRALATSARAAQRVIEGGGPQLREALLNTATGTRLIETVKRCVQHPNRFVRETAHLTLHSLAAALGGGGISEALATEVVDSLVEGLSDSWGQVRYAACVATRTFLTVIGSERMEPLLPLLLGPLCINRYYIAEGVRLYAQGTWVKLMGTSGRDRIAQNIAAVAGYYERQAKASNHAVREAACACIAELMEKIDPSAVRSVAPPLLRVLLLCYRDQSWPVREAAGVATGRCILSFPEEGLPLLPDLLPLWVAHLADNLPNIREGSAVTLGKACRAYGSEVSSRLLELLPGMLLKFRRQPRSEEYRTRGLSAAAAASGARLSLREQRAIDNDPKLHSGQEMFSCGSLAPHLSTGRQISGEGCMDWGFARDREPWEVTDGGLHLLREMAAYDAKGVLAVTGDERRDPIAFLFDHSWNKAAASSSLFSKKFVDGVATASAAAAANDISEGRIGSKEVTDTSSKAAPPATATTTTGSSSSPLSAVSGSTGPGERPNFDRFFALPSTSSSSVAAVGEDSAKDSTFTLPFLAVTPSTAAGRRRRKRLETSAAPPSNESTPQDEGRGETRHDANIRDDASPSSLPVDRGSDDDRCVEKEAGRASAGLTAAPLPAAKREVQNEGGQEVSGGTSNDDAPRLQSCPPAAVSSNVDDLYATAAAAAAATGAPFLLACLAEISRADGFLHAPHLRITCWRVLPEVAKSIGAQVFLPYLRMFVDPLFEDVSCGVGLLEVAAGRAVAALKGVVGGVEFLKRLSPEQRQELYSNSNIPAFVMPSSSSALPYGSAPPAPSGYGAPLPVGLAAPGTLSLGLTSAGGAMTSLPAAATGAGFRPPAFAASGLSGGGKTVSRLAELKAQRKRSDLPDGLRDPMAFDDE